MFNHVDVTSPSTKPKGSSVTDSEFGIVVCRRSPQARYVRIRVASDGTVRASLPKRAPLYLVRELIDSSRTDIRQLIESQQKDRIVYETGMTIGSSHKLIIRYGHDDEPKRLLSGQNLILSLPHSYEDQPKIRHDYISEQVKRTLKREATAYLPRRLRYLADMYGFTYERERFGNQKGRWGSCSSTGTISLNVALMNLPHELIDYVLIHELAHTRQMNHSIDFWQIVENCLPNYKISRKKLKSMSPIC